MVFKYAPVIGFSVCLMLDLMNCSVDSSVILSHDSRSAGTGIVEPCRTHSCSHNHSYKLAAIKLVTPSKEHLEKHYEDLSDKPFFKGLVTCEISTRWLAKAQC